MRSIIYLFQLSNYVLTDMDNKILSVFGGPTATHTKPGKPKGPAGLSSTQLGANFISVELVMPLTTSQTPSIISSGTGPAQTPHT